MNLCCCTHNKLSSTVDVCAMFSQRACDAMITPLLRRNDVVFYLIVTLLLRHVSAGLHTWQMPSKLSPRMTLLLIVLGPMKVSSASTSVSMESIFFSTCSSLLDFCFSWSMAILSSACCWVPASTKSRLESCILRSLMNSPVSNILSRFSMLVREHNMEVTAAL